jgi:hypothetical protein
MLQRCRSQPEVIIRSNFYNDFVGFTGNKGKIVRKLLAQDYPYHFEVKFSNGFTDYFSNDELEYV